MRMQRIGTGVCTDRSGSLHDNHKQTRFTMTFFAKGYSTPACGQPGAGWVTTRDTRGRALLQVRATYAPVPCWPA